MNPLTRRGASPRPALLLLLVSLSAAFADTTPFRELFDGRSLKGWKGDPQHWRVEDGAIVGEIPAGQRLKRNHWIIWEDGELKDFELRLQFRLTGGPGANSGIQFRCQAKGVTEVAGYQADLDGGATWLGRIYDEHGRALLVERGTRVLIAKDGQRTVEPFADRALFKTLFRENEWNDYRIRAAGENVSVEINGTLFAELIDRQEGQQDLSGQLAFQLHSGGHTKIEFRSIRLRELAPDAVRVPTPKATPTAPVKATTGIVPKAADGRPLNLGFEDGSLRDWTESGEAFKGQPVKQDTIASRWSGQTSGKDGDWFIGGFELLRDRPKGSLVSVPFTVTHPYAGFRLGGGKATTTRVEVVLAGQPEQILHTATGANREQMQPVYLDLRQQQGRPIFIRVVDDSSSGWGHLNFDDFRFYAERPAAVIETPRERQQSNPVLAHLVPNPAKAEGPGAETVNQMRVEPGFAVDVVAAEPRLHQPIAFTFDARGRIWVVEAHSYPQKRPDGQGLDRIVIFADENGDGRFETRTVFLEGLNLVSGLEVGHGGVWIGAAPQLLFIPDRDGDDRPDGPPEVMLDGFGFQDTHETLNSFIWGPDGWLYANQGVFNFARIGRPGTPDTQRIALSAGIWRYHPVRHEFEVFAFGGSNQWGLDFNEEGQLFMTHCRSRWGRGLTTHVIQGGHYWNQSNRGYADFVSRDAAPGYPFFRNYLLASARYGHGEGGAGKPGSRAIYGGHSHVGTMIYLGDNWPDEFRNQLLTHNLHGHQLNRQENRREGSGYNTVHAGRDVLHCADPRYVAVELKYGPDGAVYFTDWYDRQHCHNPNTEQWDRGNGRLYRMTHTAGFKPVRIDLNSKSDAELIALQKHRNAWFSRTARRLLQERAAADNLAGGTTKALLDLIQTTDSPTHRLNALWCLHAVNGLNDTLATALLDDPSEYVRAWTIQLLTDNRSVASPLLDRLVALAKNESSAFVRLYLAAAIQRVAADAGWRMASALASRAEDAADRNLPGMIWFGLAPLMKQDLDRGFTLARQTRIPALAHFIRWYAARLGGKGLDLTLHQLAPGTNRQDVLVALALALNGQRGLPMPEAWPAIAKGLYQDADERVQRVAHELGATFGDRSLFPAMRQLLADRKAPPARRQHAFDILTRAGDPDAAELFLSLLDEARFRMPVLQLASRFKSSETAPALLRRFDTFGPKEQTAALNALTSRAPLGNALLDAIGGKRLDRKHLTAYFVRQLSALNDAGIDRKLTTLWGRVVQTPAELQTRIAALEKRYSQAPLWAFSAGEGRKHFTLLCAPCHRVKNEGNEIGPNLTGAGVNGARYFIENIVDPNAVIGNDYQMSQIDTKDGESLTGIIERQTDTAVTLRTVAASVTIPRTDIRKLGTAESSMMPTGLLDQLNERQVIELLKYLSSL